MRLTLDSRGNSVSNSSGHLLNTLLQCRRAPKGPSALSTAHSTERTAGSSARQVKWIATLLHPYARLSTFAISLIHQ